MCAFQSIYSSNSLENTNFLFLWGLAEIFFLGGCLAEIEPSLKPGVKSCPPLRRKCSSVISVICPHLLNHQFSHFQFLLQIFHIQLHSWVLGHQGVNFLWQLWILLFYFLTTFAKTNKKLKWLWVCWCPGHKSTNHCFLAARITETSHLVTIFLKLNIRPPKSPPVVCATCYVLGLFCSTEQKGLTFVCTVPVSGCLAPSLTLYYAGEKGNYWIIYRLQPNK